MPRRAAKAALGLAQVLQSVADQLGAGQDVTPPPPPSLDDPLGVYDAVIDHGELRETTRQLFADKHYAQAVEEGFKCLNNQVKKRSGRTELDGASLMTTALSPGNPLLKINRLKSSSEQDAQKGYMFIAQGAMTGIRNPRAHEHRHLDEPRAAIEMLALANHLMRLIDGATRSRKRKAKA